MTLWTRRRPSNATMTTSWTSEGSRCRTFSWLIKTRSGECPCLLAPLPWPFSGLAGGAATLSSGSPHHGTSWEWGRGGKHWLVGPHPAPSLPSSLGRLQAADQSYLASGYSTQTASSCWCGSLSFPVSRTQCGRGLPKATSEARQEQPRSQGRLTEKKEFEFFFPYVDVLILINHLFPPPAPPPHPLSAPPP